MYNKLKKKNPTNPREQGSFWHRPLWLNISSDISQDEGKFMHKNVNERRWGGKLEKENP